MVGSLAEKALSTPQYYPLTQNALVNACNQSNNRDPVVSYDAATVEQAMVGLRLKGVARILHAGGGNRTIKYRHVLDEALGLDARELSLITVLLLRGPQTLNELRTRTERLSDFDSTADVARDLGRLAEREEPLVALLEREPGRREPRYVTLLTPLPVSAPGVETPASAPGTDRPVAATGEPFRGPRTTRVAPLGDDELDPRQQELLSQVDVAGGTTNIFRTLVRHPGLFRKWLPFGGKLLNGKLGARERELAILRVGWLCACEYEWAQHVPLARTAGLSEDEVVRIRAGADAPGWSEDDRAVLRATDELHSQSCISDATWSALAEIYNEQELIELVMVVGHYHLVSFALNTLGVPLEEGLAGFPD